MTDVTTNAVFPVSLVIETQTVWERPSGGAFATEWTEQIALVAYCGTERHEIAVAAMTGYEASQDPVAAVKLLLGDIAGV